MRRMEERVAGTLAANYGIGQSLTSDFKKEGHNPTRRLIRMPYQAGNVESGVGPLSRMSRSARARDNPLTGFIKKA